MRAGAGVVAAWLVALGVACAAPGAGPAAQSLEAWAEPTGGATQGGGVGPRFSEEDGSRGLGAVAAPASMPTPSPPDTLVPDVTAASYLVMDMDTGEALLQRQARERRRPASLTKVLTALLVLERADLESMVQVDEGILTLRASTLMGIEPGERLSVLDLLYGLLLRSGNDAAVALARHVAGDEPRFVAMMNARARELGMRDSIFGNSHGLDFREYGPHYSTAYDLALLTRAAYQRPLFAEIVRARTWEARGLLDGTWHRYPMRNMNELLWGYAGAEGVKIGFTGQAKQTLIAVAARDGRRLMAVVLGSTQRAVDGALLLDEGFGTRVKGGG